jgi:hypothetical protein
MVFGFQVQHLFYQPTVDRVLNPILRSRSGYVSVKTVDLGGPFVQCILLQACAIVKIVGNYLMDKLCYQRGVQRHY